MEAAPGEVQTAPSLKGWSLEKSSQGNVMAPNPPKYLNSAFRLNTALLLGGPPRSKELDLLILMGPFQLEIFSLIL